MKKLLGTLFALVLIVACIKVNVKKLPPAEETPPPPSQEEQAQCNALAEQVCWMLFGMDQRPEAIEIRCGVNDRLTGTITCNWDAMEQYKLNQENGGQDDEIETNE